MEENAKHTISLSTLDRELQDLHSQNSVLVSKIARLEQGIKALKKMMENKRDELVSSIVFLTDVIGVPPSMAAEGTTMHLIAVKYGESISEADLLEYFEFGTASKSVAVTLTKVPNIAALVPCAIYLVTRSPIEQEEI